MTRDSRALVLVTPGPEEARGEGHLGPPELGALQGDRSGGGLHGVRAVPVAGAGLGLAGSGPPLVAVAAEELGDLGLQGRLQEQPGPEAGPLLQVLAEVS